MLFNIIGDVMWIWQQENWPHFTWDKSIVEPMLREARLTQGILLGKMASQSHDAKQNMLDTLLANIINSSAIEGEKLNAFSATVKDTQQQQSKTPS